MGFSLLGLVVSAAVLAPNLLLLPFPPRDSLPDSTAPAPLTWVERAGQALCLVVPALTAPGPLIWWWLPLVALSLGGYYALWGRYLARGRAAWDLYRPVWRMPVPMAVLPVVTFAATAAWLSNPWIAASAVVLAVGHLRVSLSIARRFAPP
ncbi:hypothetical protein [Herbiconiux sp. UC225_62]|uniref:hypothetical protein n=1 Tax=Herbiconiux sp. UC225_62 TaxID=3350168 RepID=UPI0036D337B1